VGAGFLLVLDHLLRAKEPVLSLSKGCPSYPRYSWSFCVLCTGTGVCGRIGARIVFRLSTARRMTYTVVAAACRSSLIWNHG
jgi:hypothetical protein